MHHAGPENLQPPTVLADRAALTATDYTVHIDFDTRLGKWEMAAAKAHLAVRTEHTAGKGDQHPFQVRHGDVRPHSQTLNLVEHNLRARRDCLIAVAHAWQDDPDGLRMIRLHSTNLPRRGMGAQHHTFIDIKSVPHVARRMIGRHVQQLKIVQIALDLAAVENLKSHVAKDRRNLAQRLRTGMHMPQAHGHARERHVDTLLRQRTGQLGLLESGNARLKRFLEGRLYLVRHLPDLWPLCGRELTDATHDLRQCATAAQVIDTPGIEGSQIGYVA